MLSSCPPSHSMTKVNDLYKALDKDGTNAVPRPEMWAGIHADAEMAELMGKVDR